MLRDRLPLRFGYAQKIIAYCDSKDLGSTSIKQCYQMTNGNHTPTPSFIAGLSGIVKENEKKLRNMERRNLLISYSPIPFDCAV